MNARAPSVMFVLPPKASLEGLARVGQLQRFLDYYVGAYVARGLTVGVLSSGARDAELRLLCGASVAALIAPAKPRGWVWAVWAPIRHWRIARRFRVWRGMQATSVPTLAAARLVGAHAVVTYGYDYVEFSRRAGHRTRARILAAVLRKLLPRVDRVFVTSESMRAGAVAAGARPEVVVEIPHGAPIAESIDGPRTDRSVLWIGRLAPQKRLDLAIAAVGRADARLTVIGTGEPTQEELRALEACGGRYVGPQPYADVVELLDRSQVLLLTSDYEGNPKVVVDALARGAVPVVSRIEELAWLWGSLPPAAESFAPGNAESATRALARVLDDEHGRRAMARAGHQLARRSFDIAAAVSAEIAEVDVVGSRTRRVRRAAFVPKGDAAIASSRYRIYAVARELERRGLRTVVLRQSMVRQRRPMRVMTCALDVLRLIALRPQIVVLQRPGRRREEGTYARIARLLRARVIVDIDDPIDVEQKTTSLCLSLADDVVVASESLLPTLPDFVRKGARILPTPIPLRAYRQSHAGTSESVVAGWIGDGASHAAILKALVNDVATGDGDLDAVVFRFVGASRDQAQIGDVALPHNVQFVPSIDWSDEGAVASACRRFAVGLAPYRGRPGAAFKVLQYLAAGAVPLVDRRSPGLQYLHGLPEELTELCTTDFSDARAWTASLVDVLQWSLQHDAAQACRDAARHHDVSVFVDGLM